MASISEEAMRDLTEQAKRVPRDMIRDLDETARKIDGFLASFKVSSGRAASASDVMRSTSKMYNRVFIRGRPKGTVISIKKLKESAERDHSSIEQISEPITDDLMKYYKEHCRKAGVQFSILREKNKDKKDTYYVFFRAKDASLIKGCLERGMKDYKAAIQGRGKETERGSVMQKLDNYIKFVKERDEKNAAKEKHHHRSDRNR